MLKRLKIYEENLKKRLENIKDEEHNYTRWKNYINFLTLQNLV
jgi:uncharacterized membrane protein YjjP (DUF1212 family)